MADDLKPPRKERSRQRRTLDRLLGRDAPSVVELHAELAVIIAQGDELDARRAHLLDDLLRSTFDLSDLSALTQEHQNDLDQVVDDADRVGELVRNLRARIEERERANATRTRTYSRMAKGSLILQLVAVAVGLIFPSGARHAHGTHLEYYAAVAAIASVFLIAGFVELAVLGLPFAAWPVLSFAVPAIGAGTAALYVLGSHNSSPFALYLTEWGLCTTLILLVLYVVQHATEPRKI